MAQQLLERTLSKIRNEIVVQDGGNKKQLLKDLIMWDNSILPVMMSLYMKYGGTYDEERAYRKALELFKSKKATRGNADNLAKYLRVRWAAFRQGLRGDHIFAPATNDIGEKIGALQPPMMRPAVKLSAEDKPHADYIHKLAAGTYHVNLASEYYHQTYDFDELCKKTYDPTAQHGGQVYLPGFTVPIATPHQFVHPLIVALGALKDTEIDRRLVQSDIARIVSHKLKGGAHAALRTRADVELYHDLTMLPIDKFCARSHMEDLKKRANIHMHFKNEVNALRSGNLAHSSWPLIRALQTCQNSSILSFRPDSAVDMIYKLFNATAFYPTVVQQLPNFVHPGGPIPYGAQKRVPFLRVMLPQEGDTRFEELADNWNKKDPTTPLDVDYVGDVGSTTTTPYADLMYAMKPDKLGKVNWIQTPWQAIHNSQMRVADSRVLVFVVDRRKQFMAKPAFTPMSFDDLDKKVSYADVYEVNETKVNVKNEITLSWITNGKYELRSCLALEVDGDSKSCGYKAYVREKTKPKPSAVTVGGSVLTPPKEWREYSPKTLMQTNNPDDFFKQRTNNSTTGTTPQNLTNTNVVDTMRKNGIVFVYEKKDHTC